MQKRGDCMNKSVMLGSAKACQNDSESVQNPGWHVPRPSKIEAGAVHDSQDAPKMPPRALQERSKGSQSRLRPAQEPPKTAQEEPKSRPRLPNPSKLESWDLQQAFCSASSSCRASGALGDRLFDYFAIYKHIS